MSYSPEHLYYLREKNRIPDILGDWLDRGIDFFLMNGLTKGVFVKGTENIPQKDPFFIAFAPHTGVAEVFAINYAMEVNKQPIAAWMTKKETFDVLPNFLLERRYYSIARHEFDRQALQTAIRILKNRGIPGTALEGTRGEEKMTLEERFQLSINDRRQLERAQPGPVYIAWKAKAPILPVVIWGPEHEDLLPFPEEILKQTGKVGLALKIIKNLFKSRKEKPEIHIHFAPIYENHLNDADLSAKLNRSRVLQRHADRLMLERIIPNLPPDWPKGVYQHQTLETLTA